MSQQPGGGYPQGGGYPPGGGYPQGGNAPPGGGYPQGGNFPPGGGYPPGGNFPAGGGFPPGGGYPPGGNLPGTGFPPGGGYPPGNQGMPPFGGQQGYPPMGAGGPQGPGYGAPGGAPYAPPQGGGPGQGYGAPPGGAMGGFPPQGGYGAPGYGAGAGHQPGGYGQAPAGGGYGGAPYGGAQQGGSGPGAYGQAGSYGGQGAGYGAAQSGSASSMGRSSAPRGTLRPHPSFNAQADSQALRTAMKGWGTDEKAIIDVLCARSGDQRLTIVRTYKQMFGRDLIADIKSELRGRFESIMLGLLYPMEEFLARELRAAMKGLGTDEDCLVEILCTRSNKDIQDIKGCYAQVFGRDLENDIRSETSGDFRRILISMCNAHRQEGNAPNAAQARNDAQMLQQAGVMKWGTEESVFNQILANQSYDHLRLVFQEYQNMSGRNILQAIQSEMSGDLRTAYLAIAKCVINIPYYFAEKLYRSMKGAGTADKALIRIIVSRCEVDLAQIKEEYVRNFKVELHDAIRTDTSGDYRQALLLLVQGN